MLLRGGHGQMLAPALWEIGSAATAIVCTRNGLRGQVRQGNCNFHWGGRTSKNGEEDD